MLNTYHLNLMLAEKREIWKLNSSQTLDSMNFDKLGNFYMILVVFYAVVIVLVIAMVIVIGVLAIESAAVEELVERLEVRRLRPRARDADRDEPVLARRHDLDAERLLVEREGIGRGALASARKIDAVDLLAACEVRAHEEVDEELEDHVDHRREIERHPRPPASSSSSSMRSR